MTAGRIPPSRLLPMCGCPPPAVREAATQGIVREHRTCRGLARFPPIDGEGNNLPHKMRRTARGRHQPPANGKVSRQLLRP
ncbi:hypothetical protein HMPREF9141_2002 [Prevotella multiformis DSM 16608]|uniref:Uncharacterized protein n=1 Tax=Prevotella multiformis DSM 16608 TaxID=888743 RepID=F0F8T5_9BACT|nr:hypothetical protein HMPREF9141_2002 [Prevotella multiformis DSM 16608]